MCETSANRRLSPPRQIATFAYAALQFILLFYAVKKDQETPELTKATVAGSAISLAAALMLCLLSPLEHLRTLRPSTVISAFLFFAIIFDAAWVRTLWLSGSTSIAPIATTSVALKFTLLLIEAQEKADSLLNKFETYGKDELSGFFSKSLFLWLIELLRVGYGKVLSVGDLYPLEDALVSETLSRNFVEPWAKGTIPAEPDEALLLMFEPVPLAGKGRKGGSLFLALAMSLKWHILFPAFPLLCHIAFTFAQPLMAERVLTYLSEIETASPNVGYGLIGAYALVYTGLAVRIKLLPAARAADPELTAFGKDLPGMVPVSPLQVHHHGRSVLVS